MSLTKINPNETLIGKPTADIAKKLSLPYDFVSEAILDNPELKTMGELINFLTMEYKTDLKRMKGL